MTTSFTSSNFKRSDETLAHFMAKSDSKLPITNKMSIQLCCFYDFTLYLCFSSHHQLHQKNVLITFSYNFFTSLESVKEHITAEL